MAMSIEQNINNTNSIPTSKGKNHTSTTFYYYKKNMIQNPKYR